MSLNMCSTMRIQHEDPDEIFERLDKPTKIELEPRPMFIKVGALASVKGSAYMEYGNTKMMAIVEPPRELTNKQTKKSNATLGIIVCSVKYAPFALKDDPKAIERRESFMGTSLKKALEPVVCRHEFPNFQLEIKVLILDDDGCALSTAINCAGAALIEAGIPTYDLITASTVCYYRQIEFVNPNAIIEQLLSTMSEKGADDEHGIIITASLSAVGQVTECFQKGYINFETFERLSEHTLTINQCILDTVRHILINKVKNHIKKNAAADDDDGDEQIEK